MVKTLGAAQRSEPGAETEATPAAPPQVAVGFPPIEVAPEAHAKEPTNPILVQVQS